MRRETRSVTLQQSGGVWRVTHWRVTDWRAPQARPATPLALRGWRAVTFQDWSDWTRDEWTATLRRVRQAGLGPVALAMPDAPTLNTGRALGLGVRLARQSGLDVVVTFDTPLTLASLPSRVTAAAQARGALALLPGPLPDSSLNTARALGILRAAQPLPLVTGRTRPDRRRGADRRDAHRRPRSARPRPAWRSASRRPHGCHGSRPRSWRPRRPCPTGAGSRPAWTP